MPPESDATVSESMFYPGTNGEHGGAEVLQQKCLSGAE